MLVVVPVVKTTNQTLESALTRRALMLKAEVLIKPVLWIGRSGKEKGFTVVNCSAGGEKDQADRLEISERGSVKWNSQFVRHKDIMVCHSTWSYGTQ